MIALQIAATMVRLVWAALGYRWHMWRLALLDRKRYGRHGIRPRYGMLTRTDGSAVPIVYHPREDDPTRFVAKYADTEEVAIARPGDSLEMDRMRRGQSIMVKMDLRESDCDDG